MDEAVPILGVHIFKDDKYLPPEIAGGKVIGWTWDGIGTWIKTL